MKSDGRNVKLLSERVEEGQLQAKQSMFCVKSLCSNARIYS